MKKNKRVLKCWCNSRIVFWLLFYFRFNFISNLCYLFKINSVLKYVTTQLFAIPRPMCSHLHLILLFSFFCYFYSLIDSILFDIFLFVFYQNETTLFSVRNFGLLFICKRNDQSNHFDSLSTHIIWRRRNQVE